MTKDDTKKPEDSPEITAPFVIQGADREAKEPLPPLSRRAFLGLIGLGALGVGALGLGALGALSRPFEGARALGLAASGQGWHDYGPPGPPNPERLIMIIDLRKLTAEKALAIQTTCHLAHNVPLGQEDLAWVKLKPADQVFFDRPLEFENIPSFCHHCDRPLCVSVCPTGATFKRPNGLVVQDVHRCLGCRFCQRACPYGARGYNPNPVEAFPADQPINRDYPRWGRGVVAKCSFCEEQPQGVPLCLKAAPEALAFGTYRKLAHRLERARQDTAGHPAKAVSLGPNLYYLV